MLAEFIDLMVIAIWIGGFDFPVIDIRAMVIGPESSSRLLEKMSSPLGA